MSAPSANGATTTSRSSRRTVAPARRPRRRNRCRPVERAEFEQVVADALGTIPGHFRAAMSNIAIVVQDEPTRELLRELGIVPPDTLFGLYQGIPLTERRWDYGNALPDRILLFQRPH